MSTLRVARRYALALFDLAEERKETDAVVRDLDLVQRIVKESRDFLVFLKSPVIKKEKKKEVIAELLGKRISQTTMEFIQLLCSKGREDVLPAVIEAFFTLRDERLGIVTVEVRAATQLSDAQLTQIQRTFEGITKKKVRVSFSVDGRLRGGFIARVGDTVYDGSVAHQLQMLRRRFAAAGMTR